MMSNKPNWKDAPEDAEWLAQDANGEWWFYVSKPKPLIDTFSGVSIGVSSQGNHNPNWKNSLEKRPVEEFEYPIYKKWCYAELVVKFTDLQYSEVIVGDAGWEVGQINEKSVPHTDQSSWEDWTSPDEWEEAEKRMDIIGQNGNDGIHYKYLDPVTEFTMDEPINPEHYKTGGIETIDYMKAKSTQEEFKGHLRLTAMKYLSRYGHKDDTLQELKKAKWYLDRLIKELEQ